MKSFAENYGKDAASVMRDLSMYKVLKKEQLLGLYPGRQNVIEKVLLYLVKQRRIWKVGDYLCATPDALDSIDPSMVSAVWVLLDFIERVSYHSAGDYPAKVVFYADGNIYENVMPDNDIVLEIKYDSYIPSRILHLLTDISTVQESVSKYIICSDRLRERLY